MPKETKYDSRESAEDLIERLYSCDDIPEDELEDIRMRLISNSEHFVNNEALRAKFLETFKYEENPKYSIEMWPEMAARLGLDVNLVETRIQKNKICGGNMPVRIPLRRRMALKVIAVLMPLLVIGAALYLLVDKTGTSGGQIRGMVTVSVAADSTQTILLPDESILKAESGSSLTYAEDFEDERCVTLNGEAFFSVAKNAEKPFTVKSGIMKITVLGTEFYVKAREEDRYNEVTVESGKVMVTLSDQSITLERMQQMKLDKHTNTFEVANISEEDLARLRGLGFSLKGSTLDETFRIMSRFFSVKFKVAANLTLDERIAAGFKDDITLEKALSIVKLISNTRFDYQIESDTVTITKRKR